MAIGAQSPLDVNLALFETLGRIGLGGLWLHWLGDRADQDRANALQANSAKFLAAGLALIANNPALRLPISDRQNVQLALFLQFWFLSENAGDEIVRWLREMANRLDFSVRTQGRYPCVFSDYRDLAEHPRYRTEEYFQEATAGSSLIPLLAAWLYAFQEQAAVHLLEELVKEKLPHCTLQLWMADRASENQLYVGEEGHGRALSDLPLKNGVQAMIATIREACRRVPPGQGLRCAVGDQDGLLAYRPSSLSIPWLADSAPVLD
jgi:hypothetical protein